MEKTLSIAARVTVEAGGDCQDMGLVEELYSVNGYSEFKKGSGFIKNCVLLRCFKQCWLSVLC